MIALTLTDFLLERIAEKELEAKRLIRYGGSLAISSYRNRRGELLDRDPVTVGTLDPGYLLAECQAKRLIVEEHDMMPLRRWRDGELSGGVCMTCTAGGEYGDTNKDGTLNYCPTLRFLALPYVEHPDYREEWRP